MATSVFPSPVCISTIAPLTSGFPCQQLHVVMSHAEFASSCLTCSGKTIHNEIFQWFTGSGPVGERSCKPSQSGIVHCLHFSGHRLDLACHLMRGSIDGWPSAPSNSDQPVEHRGMSVLKILFESVVAFVLKCPWTESDSIAKENHTSGYRWNDTQRISFAKPALKRIPSSHSPEVAQSIQQSHRGPKAHFDSNVSNASRGGSD